MANKNRIGVTVRKGNVDKAINIFTKMVKSSGILYEFRNNQEFTKPSTEKRLKKKEAKYKQKIADKNNK